VERRDFNLKIKSTNADGTFTGLGAVYNNVDLGNDKILPGAFTRTLAGSKQFPLLWQHNQSDPIGTAKVTDTPQGLMVEGQLLLSDPTAAKAYTFMKAGVIKGLSIGYDTIQASYDGDVRNLTELRLWEVSCVTFPMNEMALVSSVKSLSDGDRAKHLKAISQHQKAIDRHQKGIAEHLKSMFDGLDDEDAEDLALIESDEGDDEDESKAFLVELQKLAEQTASLVG
jgi:HK97 family phage prohead protease